MSWNGRGSREGLSTTVSRFPLSIHSSGRYLIQANGTPFFIHGDTPWSIVVQLTEAQINTYLYDRAAKGINAIMFNAIERKFSSQSPAYRTVGGYDPFTSMTDFASPNENYWKVVDYIVNKALELNILCIINPAYWGYGGGSEGWWTELNAETAGDLQTFGTFLANRYKQPNIVWCMGGDWSGGDNGVRGKQWNIVTGIRTVRTTDIITAHNGRTDGDAYSDWSSFTSTGFNLNNIYTQDIQMYSEAAIAIGRSMPFFLIEAWYEGAANAVSLRRQYWGSVLSGACGHLYGCDVLWGFGEPNFNGAAGPAAALANYLTTAGTVRLVYFKHFWDKYDWTKLVPKTDASLVSTSLSTDATRVYPALASDGSFAVIWKNDTNSITVVMSNLQPSSVRARWYDPSNNTYTTVSGSPFANTGSQSIGHPGNNSGGTTDWVLVLDSA
jgi:hypothetical protein